MQGLRGFVRNLDNGSVEVVAAGATGALESLRSSLERGPQAARVDRVHEEELVSKDEWNFEGNQNVFDIR